MGESKRWGWGGRWEHLEYGVWRIFARVIVESVREKRVILRIFPSYISHFHRPNISLQGTYANFYHHSNLPPAGFSVSVNFSQSQFPVLYLCLYPTLPGKFCDSIVSLIISSLDYAPRYLSASCSTALGALSLDVCVRYSSTYLRWHFLFCFPGIFIIFKMKFTLPHFQPLLLWTLGSAVPKPFSCLIIPYSVLLFGLYIYCSFYMVHSFPSTYLAIISFKMWLSVPSGNTFLACPCWIRWAASGSFCGISWALSILDVDVDVYLSPWAKSKRNQFVYLIFIGKLPKTTESKLENQAWRISRN